MVTSMSRTTWRATWCTSGGCAAAKVSGRREIPVPNPASGVARVNVAINRFTESTRQVLRTHFQIFRARRGP